MERPEAGDDAQRALEQKALKNVRGLVDKIEASDAAERTLQKRILVGFAVAIVVIGGLWMAGAFDGLRGGSAKELVVAPPKSPAR
jgi:hypothetical protein